MVSHSSYLQTLERTEAIALVTSLQKIKVHLSDELQRMNAQVQQKTTQLQEIEVLLSEATTSDVGSSATSSTQKLDSGKENGSSSSSASTNGSSPLFTTADDQASENAASAPTQVEIEKPSPQPKQDPSRQQSDRSTSKSSKAAAAKTKSAPTKKTNSASKSTSATKSQGKVSSSAQSGSADGDLRQFLRAKFRNKSMADAVAQFLDDSKQPASIDDVVSGVYSNLSRDSYKRAKTAVTNLLSVGRSKGLWKSSGRGKYISNQATTA